jgi:hypothetical protein
VVPRCGASPPDDLDPRALAAPGAELAVEDLLPGAEVELSVGDGNDDLAAHHLALEVGVAVVLTCAVVALVAGGCVGRQFLEPVLVVLVQAGLVVI